MMELLFISKEQEQGDRMTLKPYFGQDKGIKAVSICIALSRETVL